MKKISLIAFIIIVIVSCKKDHQNINQLSLLLNENAWTGIEVSQTVLPTNMGRTVLFKTFNDNGFLREQFTLTHVPKVKGSYPIVYRQGYTTDIDTIYGTFTYVGGHGDFTKGRYNPLYSNSSLSIEDYDEQNSILSGSVFFIGLPTYINSSVSGLPDSVLIEGNFVIHLE